MEALTRYEAAEVVSLRASLLYGGAQVKLTEAERNGRTDPVWIATEELRRGRLDAVVRRLRPDGTATVVHVRDCALPDNVACVLNS